MAEVDLWPLVDAALDRALGLDGPSREAFVRGLDPAVRAAVEPLLVGADLDDPLLDRPAAALLGGEAGPGVVEGARVGPYRIEALVGEGGMGRVYRARRADGAFEQTVALKVVRQSLVLAGADVAVRLRRERALLASLDHPNIARLLDGGETPDGVPYLVLEYVDGTPITAWADAQGLDVRARLRLFVRVARAVDHAHRRFVVHRDLKPSNILVADRDGAPRPVVLDFGIAKLLEAGEQAGSAAFPLTRTGMRLLTPAYAAPELYRPEATVTTAADVYGLGAVLYELLTGCRPHDDRPTPGPASTEPTRPSRRVTVAAGGGPRGGPRRVRALEGDLDTICLKALHPDASRRYPSALELAEDLERHLAGRPVEARPDSVAYVVGRFARRHRWVVAAASVAVAALVGGLGVSLAALAGEREAREQAEASAARATEAAELMGGVFEAADPRTSDGRVVSAHEILDTGLERLAGVEAPVLRGYLAGVLGRTYHAIGDRALGDSLLEASVHLLDRPGVAPDLRARALLDLAYAKAQFESGRAIVLYRRLLDDASAGREIDHVLAGRALRGLALAYSDAGRPADGIEAGRRAIDIFREAGDEAELAAALRETGTALASAGLGGEAELREAVALTRALKGADSFDLAADEERLAWVLSMGGSYVEALPIYQRSLERNLRVFGPDHMSVALAYENIGHILVGLGEHEAAIAPIRAAVAVYEQHFPPPIPNAELYRDLAIALNRTGRHADAEAAARAGLESAALTPGRETVRAVRRQLGLALFAQDRRGEARAHLTRAVADTARAQTAPAVDAAEHARAVAALASLRP